MEELSGLFVQVVKACQSEGLVRLVHMAIDGTKMKSNASKKLWRSLVDSSPLQ